MDVRAIHQLAAHDHQSPARITEEARRASFLSRKNVKHSSRSASTIARCGITFFYEPTLKRAWSTLTFVRAPREQKLPVILSVEAVRTILAHLKLLRSRVCLTTIYACGLRLQAGTHLQVPAIDRARMLVPGRYGTGATDRSVPWPTRPLALLRQYWPTPHNPVWLFPTPGRGGIGMARATAPRPRHSVQEAFRAARKRSGIQQWYPEARLGPHPPSSLCDPSAGGRHQSPAHPGLCGAQRADHTCPLSPSDRHSRCPGTRCPPGAHGGSLAFSLGVLPYSNARTSSAAMAPTTALHSAPRCHPHTCEPCMTWRGVARRAWAGRCPMVSHATTLIRAPTRVSTGLVPHATMRTPSSGWNTSSVCCCQSRLAWSPSPSLRHCERWPAATQRPCPACSCGLRPRPSRHWLWTPEASAAGALWWGDSIPGPAPSATTRTCMTSRRAAAWTAARQEAPAAHAWSHQPLRSLMPVACMLA